MRKKERKREGRGEGKTRKRGREEGRKVQRKGGKEGRKKGEEEKKNLVSQIYNKVPLSQKSQPGDPTKRRACCLLGDKILALGIQFPLGTTS